MTRRKFPGIYKITHTSGQFYIGKSTDVTVRWKSHLNSFFNGKNSKRLQALWNSSHYTQWSFSIIKLCKVKELDQLETYYIQQAVATVDPGLLLNKRLPKPTTQPTVADQQQ